jgi:hypothetical protein
MERMAFVPEGQADRSQARSALGLKFGDFEKVRHPDDDLREA